MATTQTEELLTLSKAAALLKVSPLTLQRWIREGRLTSCRVSQRAERVRRSDVEQIVAARRLAMPEPRSVTSAAELPPRSEKETQRLRELVQEAREARESMAARNGGKPLAESWPIINEERDKRDGNFD